MRKLGIVLLLLTATGCAVSLENWEPQDDGLQHALQYCREDMLQRDPLLGPFWSLSKDLRPCMEDRGYFKR